MGDGSELEEMLVQLRKVELCFSELESCPKAILSAARPVKKYYYTKMFRLATIVSLDLTLHESHLFPGQRIIFYKNLPLNCPLIYPLEPPHARKPPPPHPTPSKKEPILKLLIISCWWAAVSRLKNAAEEAALSVPPRVSATPPPLSL